MTPTMIMVATASCAKSAHRNRWISELTAGEAGDGYGGVGERRVGSCGVGGVGDAAGELHGFDAVRVVAAFDHERAVLPSGERNCLATSVNCRFSNALAGK